MDEKEKPTHIELRIETSKEEGSGDQAAELVRLQTLQYTPEEEKKLIRKYDLHIVSFLAALYLLSYLDRSNIGNAKTAGMNKSLGISDSSYQWLLTIFYISYITFQFLTLCWKWFPPRYYVPVVVIGWGIVSTCAGAAQNWGGLMAIRFLLGVFEAGFGPGVPYYLTFFYYRHEIAWRTGLFMSVSPLSSAFAGALAYGITRHNLAISGWRVLFLVEGLPTIAMGMIAFYAIQNEGRLCRFLTPREKDIAASRAIKQTGSVKRSSKLDFEEVKNSLFDLKNWCCMLMFFSLNVTFSSLPVYMPTIIEEMGYSSVNAQAYSAPPYLVTFFLVLLCSHGSDYFRVRSWFITCVCLVGCVGFLLLTFVETTGVRYFACYLGAAGVYPAIPILITWSGNCHGSDGKKGVGFVLLQIVGQCGPLLGTRLYPDSDGPMYRKGCLICFAFLLFASFLSLVLRFHLIRLNKKLDERYGPAEGNPFDPRDALALEGENNRNFRYIL